MKKIIITVIICFCVFWVGRIYSINQNPPISTYYNIGDTIDCGDLSLQFIESHLDDPYEFKNRFGFEYSDGTGEFKIISFCINATNRSNMDIGWDALFNFLECGFESPVWVSSIDPIPGAHVNVLHNECLKPGKSQKIWFMTKVNKNCFSNSAWEHVNEYQYSYVLSLTPQKTAVRLEV